MKRFIIKGPNNAVRGEVSISGAKNAVLPIMTAALMADGISRIDRVPDLRDTRTMIKLMEIVGAKCSFEKGSLKIDGSSVDNPEAPYDLVKTMRASFYVLGPLLARFGSVKVSLPGGCAIGTRPIDIHLKALSKLGVKYKIVQGYVHANAPKGLRIDQLRERRKVAVSRGLFAPARHQRRSSAMPEGNHREASTGVIAIASKNEDTNIAITATAMDPRKSPPAPGSMTNGRKARTVVRVDDISGIRMRDTAPFIASVGGSPFNSRLRISSVITMEPSTSKPSATTSPVTDMCWMGILR